MPTFIKRVALKNYKSIAACDVALQSLTFLVGPNGSGKSNFLDALRFVTDGLRTSLDHALRDRGGLKDVRHRAGGQPGFGIRLEFQLPEGEEGYYAFLITAKRDGFQVQRERCWVRQRGAESRPVQFEVRSGEITGQPEPISPAAYPDRLYLVAASGLPAFRRVYDALSSFAFYSLAPAIMRDPQKREDGYPLLRDGANLASALAFMSQARPETKRRVEEYLSRIVDGIQSVEAQRIDTLSTILFRQISGESAKPTRFTAANMSDGTLRALGILVALFQNANGNGAPVSLVGIEEPELALHPAAVGVLIDSLREASHFRQVLVTSHSPDLLDDKRTETDSILAVAATDGVTQISGLDEVSRSVLRDRLYTAGELLRMSQLQPDPQAARRLADKQPDLFAPYAP